MIFSRSIIALVILTAVFSTILVAEVQAIEVVDPSVTANATGNNTTFLGSLQDIFTTTIQLIIDIVLTPFQAISSIWTSWASTMGWWAGPIVAAFVIVVVLVMIRLYSEFDEWMDKNSG